MKFELRTWFERKLSYVRFRVLDRWHNVPEKTRKPVLETITRIVNCLYSAALIAVPFSMITRFSYLESVIFFWFLIPVVEHYFRWFRRDWHDDLVEK